MKSNLSILSVLFLSYFSIIAQPYSIGHKQITFIDPSRSNRNIQTEVYYPSSVAGDNTPIVNSSFPILIFGHGFVMSWDAYKCFWDSLVPEGYIIVFPKTEGGISPDHNEFGKDLRFLNEQFKVENNTPSSFFYQRVSNKSAIMGHSMGGGASFLAASNYTNFTTLINFAAANTNPSAIDAAKYVTVPLLMFSGSNDGVTPPVNHQVPMFDSCNSTCKTHITITGGGHCYFANYNFNCSFGESTTSPQPSISRSEQQRRVFYILKPYLGHILKNNLNDSILFFNRLQNNAEYSYVRQCSYITTDVLSVSPKSDIILSPNPFNDSLKIGVDDDDDDDDVFIYNTIGEIIWKGNIKRVTTINTSEWPKGVYYIKSHDKITKIIKL